MAKLQTFQVMLLKYAARIKWSEVWVCYIKSTNGTIDSTYEVCITIKSMNLLYFTIHAVCRDKWLESDSQTHTHTRPFNNDLIFMTLITLIIIYFWIIIIDSACLPRSMRWNSSIVLNNRGIEVQQTNIEE